MIIKEYRQNIDCAKPRNYFERWYADMWHRRIAAPTIGPDMFWLILGDELSKVGATLDPDHSKKLKITFNDDQDYTLFVLRWS